MDTSPFADAELDLAPAEVQRRIAAGEAQLIDVREQYEWDAGRIDGARHIEIERVAWNARSIDRDLPVIFHCRLGWRAGMVAHAFRAIGYDAYNLAGGLLAWSEAGLPLIPEGGTISEH
jgi:hydroxyacylglutathione hydrolase/adenylyltransferase/sulfurtransferase